MFRGLSGVSLSGRLARRLLAVFALAALLPVALASLVTYQTLSSIAADRQAQHLSQNAKSAALAIFGRLEIANTQLAFMVRSAAEGSTSIPAEALASEYFSELRQVPATGEVHGSGLPVLTKEQEAAVRDGGTALAWSGARPGASASTYLVRSSADGRDFLYARLKNSWFWQYETIVQEQAAVSVSDTNGTVLFTVEPKEHVSTGAAADTGSAPEPRRGHGDAQWRTGQWELFLGSGFAATPWRVVVREPAGAVRAEFDGLRAIVPLMLLGALALAVLLGMSQLRRYLGPLETLTNATRRLAARDFGATVDIRTNDELALLGENFNQMASSLREQFATLETMADVDRQLLCSPGLERILDSLLPRVSSVLGCEQVSVLLHDFDADDHARVYSFRTGAPEPRPVSRVVARRAELERATDGLESLRVAAGDDGPFEFAAPMRRRDDDCVEIWPLRHSGRLWGLLCLVYSREALPESANTTPARGFADRLSVALANLSHQQELERQAHFDSLTGLANRERFRQQLTQCLADSAATSRSSALLYIDLDRFKDVNDSAGHGAGDSLLEAVAQRLAGCVPRGNTVARLGGDEFAVIVDDAKQAEQVARLAAVLLESIATPVAIDGAEYRVSASVGVAMYPRDGETVDELLRNSDIAMYRAKEQGRGRMVFFSQAMHSELQRRISLEAALRQALEADELVLHYQPIVKHDRITGCEALLRWTTPAGEKVSPAVFIPIAEQSDLIVGVGDWVLQRACRDFERWKARGVAPEYVSVNVAPRQLREAGFVERVRELLDRHAMQPEALQIELTESVIADGAEAERKLRLLSLHGVRLALDDFGTGYSSLSHLHRFPFNVVKIDCSFVMELTTSRVAWQLVRAIVQMAAGLEMPVVAEGVQTPNQRDALLELGCFTMQGYLYSPAVPAGEMEKLLSSSREPVQLSRIA